MARTDAHEALLKKSAGYAAFAAEEQEVDKDAGFLVGFADWLLAGKGETQRRWVEGWSADRFRREWDRWHS